LVFKKGYIDIEYSIQKKLEELAISLGIETEDMVVELISHYENRDEKTRELEKKLNELEKENKLHKNRALTALELGDAVLDGICIVDSQGIVTEINKGYTEITGISKDEIVGRNIQDMLDRKYFTSAVSLDVLKNKNKVSAISVIKNNNKNKKVLITGNPFMDEEGDVSQVITVMRDFTEINSLRERLEKAENESKKYLSELKYIREIQNGSEFIGNSLSARKIRQMIEQVSKTDATILITGETGVGKEIIAREVYKNSNRSDGPYIKINCAAIPDTLLESELFGYEKGAFTGALQKDKIGLLEMGHKGTVLLDEIGEMPMQLQSKILRFLQEREITRVGGTIPKLLDVRVIAATNQNLLEQIKQGKFREDLYYRLNVIPIIIPPIRDRKEDIRILAYKFLGTFNKKYSKHLEFDESGLQALEHYNWPGNVRELENMIERLVITTNEEFISVDGIMNDLGSDKFPMDLFTKDNITLKEAVHILEKNMIEKALRKHGNTYKAAEALGVGQSTIVRKAQALGIEN
jgi:PAS domain S-box-containing protein